MTQGRRPEPRLVDGTYALEECLGTGGMGSVYRARHVLLNKAFALKLIHPKMLTSQDGLRRFEVEAKALGRLDHPSIVRVTDYGVDEGGGGAPYLVMEYLEGETLKDLIERQGAVAPETAMPLLEAVAEGLDYAHGQGILHRDLKPHNVILARDPSGRVQAKIVDFGLARFVLGVAERVVGQAVHSGLFDVEDLSAALDGAETADTMALARGAGASDGRPVAGSARADDVGVALGGGELSAIDGSVPTGLTQAGTLVGTAGYMAPEIADREGATPASDVYSFGVVAYELLVGKKPFTGSFMALLRAHVFDPPPVPSAVNPALPAELDAPILAPLAKVPAERPPSAGEVVRRLREAWEARCERRWRARELPRRVVAAAAIAALAAALAVVSSGWPVLEDLEGRLVDLRFGLSGARPPDDRLALALLDDATLDTDPARRRIVDYDQEVAAVLGRVLQAGALGVGIDMVLPDYWRDAFEPLLLAYPDRVALALHWDRDTARYRGAELAEGPVTILLGPERAAGLFGLANLDQDADGVVRRMRQHLRDEGGVARPVFARKVASIVREASPDPGENGGQEVDPGRFWVDYRVDWRSIPRWSWKDLAALAAERPDRLRGLFLMVGGDIEGYGDTAYPLSHPRGLPREAPGVVVQALLVNTLLDGQPLRGPVLWPSGLALAALLPLSLAVLWLRRLARALLLVGSALAAFAGLAFALFVAAQQVVPVAAVALVYPLAAAAALALRWRLPLRPGSRGFGSRRSS